MPILNAIRKFTLSKVEGLNAKRGFTLIELLVVISIIAILITVIVASFATAQGKARDSRRKTDLDAHKKALELYKSDNAAGLYPACAGAAPAGPCQITSNASYSQVGGIGNQTTTAYFGTNFPADPRNTGTCGGTAAAGTFYAANVGVTYCYWPQGTVVGAVGDEQYPGYIISACLENGGDQGLNTYQQAGNATGPNCDGNGAAGAANDRTYGFQNP